MKKNWKNIVWGVLLIATAIFIIFAGMGYAQNVGVVKIIFTVVFAGVIITSIPGGNFAGITFPLAFLAIMYDKELGIENLTPWPVIAIALLVSIGLSLIFKKHPHHDHHDWNKEEWTEEVINGEDGEIINCEARFSGATKYINSENMSRVNIRSSFGGLSVYFDNAKIPSGKAVIDLDCKFGGVELYIPRNWNVIQQQGASFGGVDEKGHAQLTQDSPQVLLTGSVSFSGVDIKYI